MKFFKTITALIVRHRRSAAEASSKGDADQFCLAPTRFRIREGIKKKRFFWDIFPKYGWVGWLIPKQGSNPSEPPPPPKITPKIALFDPNFTFRFPKFHKNPGVGKQIWDMSPKKRVFFYSLP